MTVFSQCIQVCRLLSNSRSAFRNTPTTGIYRMASNHAFIERAKHFDTIPEKLLLGPGPSNPFPSVYKAMTTPLVGHLHPEFIKVMDDIRLGLQYVMQTKNRVTLCISGTGHSGMEASLINLMERGEKVLIAEHGVWGSRAAEMSERAGFVVQRLVNGLGQCHALDEIEVALKSFKPKVFFICHSESSTGVAQPLEGIGALCHKYDCLLIVDTVASLGGFDVPTDKLEIDVHYSGSQKVLGAPPGLAPITFSERAWKAVLGRKSKPQSFYMDIQHLANYWGCTDEPARYHHTGEISTCYALREGLRCVAEEGLENSIARHARVAKYLHKRLAELKLELFVEDPKIRLPTLTTVKVPEGVNAAEVQGYIMKNFNIEIAGGLGPTTGKIWRIGLMGYNSKEENVDRAIAALKEAIAASRKNANL